MTEWPLVGRDAEMQLLRGLLTGSTARGVVLAGAAGVGKTRLAHEALSLAERAGMPTAQVTATRSAAQLPFGALAPLLPEQPVEGAAVDDRADLLRRTMAALAEQSGERTLVLLVDDAQLLDDASATLVQQLAATGAAVVLATVRSGEPAPDPVVALWKDGLAERVEVYELDAEATAELLSRVLDGPVDPGAAVQFTERCRGNALFLRELVIGALGDGSLVEDNGIWCLREPLSPSARLVEIIESRLGRLDDEERSLLEVVAYGEPLGQAELMALADPALAEDLERRELLASDMDGRRLLIHLAHPLYGDVVRARTPAIRARTIAESLADAVETTRPVRQADVLRVAAWRLMSGGSDPEVMLKGARVARWRYDFPLAERLARAAAESATKPEIAFEAALLAAQLASLQGRAEEAERELAGLAAGAVNDAQRGSVAVTRFDNAGAWLAEDPTPMLDQAVESVTDSEWRDRIDARRLVVILRNRGPRAAADAAASLLARADSYALVVASVVGAYALARTGRIAASLDASGRGRAAREHLVTPTAWYAWWHAAIEVRALHYAGRFREADELIAMHHSKALADGSTEARAVFAASAAAAVGEQGRVRTAERRAREALALNEQLGRYQLAREDHVIITLALALAGRAEEAVDELAALDASGSRSTYLTGPGLMLARAWTAVSAGDLPAARAHLEHAADVGEHVGDLVGAADALHGLARLGAARDVRDRLARVAEQIEGDLAPARLDHTDALARGDAAALEAASYRFEEMGADLLAAEAAADAAVARRRAGELREAAADERRTAILVERCEDPVTPALQATEARARLTPAERETAILAASGRPNKEIAEQLFLSPRTVENRLQRVYEKLGISGRTELAEALAIED